MRSPGNPLVVAVVSDDGETTRKLARCTSALGHRVLAFSSPALAREALVTDPVGVVVAVRRMEPVSGCELADQLGEAHGARRAAFILVMDPADMFDTGSSLDAVLSEMFDVGAMREAIARALHARCSDPAPDDAWVRLAFGGAAARR